MNDINPKSENCSAFGESKLLEGKIVAILAALLTCILALATTFYVLVILQPKSWTGVAHIKADGSIYPADAPIRRNGDIYTLTSNINGSLVIERGKTRLDGASFGIYGMSDEFGIRLEVFRDITIENIEISNFRYGICFASLGANITIVGTIMRNVTTSFWDGGAIMGLSGSRIVGNLITGGIIIGFNCTVSDNYITPPDSHIVQTRYKGFGVSCNSSNTICRNTIGYFGTGIYAKGENNNIFENTLVENFYALEFGDSHRNLVVGNTIENNFVAIRFELGASNSKFHHNNFINNTSAIDDPAWFYHNLSISTNIWDDGYPSGGNYWGKYKDADIYSGPFQNQTESDGICDNPVTLYASNQDRYPLMKPWRAAIHDYTLFYAILMTGTVLAVSVATAYIYILEEGEKKLKKELPET